MTLAKADHHSRYQIWLSTPALYSTECYALACVPLSNPCYPYIAEVADPCTAVQTEIDARTCTYYGSTRQQLRLPSYSTSRGTRVKALGAALMYE